MERRPVMRQFEYLIQMPPDGDGPLQDMLNYLGENGWELVVEGVTERSELIEKKRNRLIFIREKERDT